MQSLLGRDGDARRATRLAGGGRGWPVVLGSCFAIAYEWSGSILVPMTMHTLFNALTLTALAFPELIKQ